MALHPWWGAFGSAVEAPVGNAEMVSSLWLVLKSGITGASIHEIRHDASRDLIGFRIEVEVERPQDIAYPLSAVEPIAIIMSTTARAQPSVLALRDNFPDTPHQNWVPEGMPVALCIDDRPWSEAALSWTPADTVRRIQQWLAKAARGELHDAARPLDPLFFPAPQSIVIPRAALVHEKDKPAQLVGFVHPEDKRVIVTVELDRLKDGPTKTGRLIVAVVRAGERVMSSMRRAPVTLASLAHELEASDVDLANILKERIYTWLGLDREGILRLSSHLALVVAFPVRGPNGQSAEDLRAFVSTSTVGEVGVALGALYRNESGSGAPEGFVRAMPAGPSKLEDVWIEPCEVHMAFDAEVGANMAGYKRDERRVLLIGAGALGSQLAINLAREGAFHWTIVDEDQLLPHNLARHALAQQEIGLPKAVALARRIEALQDARTACICADVERPEAANEAHLHAALGEADVIIDASASVSAGRQVSDFKSPARRVSVFFNPAGTDVVVLTEAADRSVTLRDLEAQYYAFLLSEPDLRPHLVADTTRLRYSGSCRSLTNRIPASNAALLSALASRGVRMGLGEEDASIRLWSVGFKCVTALFERRGRSVTRTRIGDWDLAYDDAVLDSMKAMRAARLPAETGGVLLGVADMKRQSLHVVVALPPPNDSAGSSTSFERGIDGLSEVLRHASEITMHQVRYIGEWHSHPDRSSTMPSETDRQQLAWLLQELSAEGMPALMAIAGDNNQFSFLLSEKRADL